MKIKNLTINVILSILSCISLFGLIAGSNEKILGVLRGSTIEQTLYNLHSGNQILFSMSGGLLISIFFWLLVVKIPEIRKRNIIKHNISTRYQYFKEDTIQILLDAAAVRDSSQLPRKLCDYKEFRIFFEGDNRQKWYDAMNGLQNNSDLLNEILIEMELLSEEISYVLNNVEIADEQIMNVFKQLSINIYKLKTTNIYSDDQVKYVG